MMHLDYLDALRGIAVLGVITVHCSIFSRQTELAGIFFFSGQRGVQLFYIVSAFTLCRSLDLRHDSQINFLIRRFFRVAPLFYIAICINLWLHHSVLIPDHDKWALSKFEIASGFVFLNGLLPRAINTVAMGGWSIAVETTFYLILPFVFARFGTLRKSLWLFVISACICLGASQYFAMTAADAVHEQYFAFLYFPVEFPVFVLGILAYFVWRDYLSCWSAQLCGSDRTNIAALFLIAAILIFGGSFPLGDGQLYCSSLMFVPLLFSLAIHPWKVAVNRLTIYLGKISYSVYLLHFVVLFQLSKVIAYSPFWEDFAQRHVFDKVDGFFIAFVIVISITAVIASVSHWLIERPSIFLGRLLIRNLQPALGGAPLTNAMSGARHLH